MKKLLLGAALFLSSFVSFSDAFIISELYGGTGNAMSGQQWLELFNISREKIIVEKVRLEISAASESPLITEEKILEMPVEFSDRLVVTQQKNLGLSHCFEHEPMTVIMPRLFIKHREEQRICVTINDRLKTCVIKGAKAKMLSGTSLFRDVGDLNEEPLWRHEPCHLIDKIFASPGLHDRFCTQMRKEHVFRRCDYLRELHVERSKKMARDLLPLLDHGIEAKKTKESVTIRATRKFGKGLFLGSLCAKPEGSEKICHQLTHETPMTFNTEHLFPITLWTQKMGNSLGLEIADLLGNIATKNLDRLNQEKENIEENMPHFLLKKSSRAEEVILIVNLRREQLPINIVVKSRDGEVIIQRSFVTGGEKNITIPTREVCALFVIDYSGRVSARTVYSHLQEDCRGNFHA